MSLTLKPYQEYKDSGQAWLGRVPTNWNIVPAFAVFKERQQKNVGLREKQVLSLSYGRIIKKRDDALHGLVPASFEGYQVVEPGNIILRFTDLQNDQRSLRVGLVKDRGIITSAYVGLTLRDQLLPDYAYYLLHSADVQKVFYGMGSGLRQSLGFADLRRMPVVVPDIEEQKRIVRFLAATGLRTDKLIRAKRRMIQLLNEQKQAIIQQVVTRGLDPNIRLKPLGTGWNGDVPEHWEFRRAKQLCKAIIDCKNRTPEMVEGGEFTVVRTTNIRDGRFALDGSYPTDRGNYEIWTQRGAPRAGDVFFTREAPAGEACLVPGLDNLCMGQRMMYFRPDPALLDARFLLYSIYGPVGRTYVEHVSNGSTVGHLRLGDVYAFPILWCPVEEQRWLVQHIETSTSPLDCAIGQASREIVLLREYRTRLITDVVTGKLDLRGVELPELEEAEEIESLSGVADEELEDSEELVAADGGADAD